MYAVALDGLEAIGGQRLEIDFCPFMAVAHLLYAGPWVAERLVAVGKFFYDRPEALHPVTRAILASAEKFSAGDAFAAQYQLRTLARRSEAVWQQVDLLALPTTGTIYTLHEVAADPINLNTTLGYYTNFVNLLGLSALALPAGFTNSVCQWALPWWQVALQNRCYSPLAAGFSTISVRASGPLVTPCRPSVYPLCHRDSQQHWLLHYARVQLAPRPTDTDDHRVAAPAVS